MNTLPDKNTFYKLLFEAGYRIQWVDIGVGLSYYIIAPDGQAIVPRARDELFKMPLEEVNHHLYGWIGYQRPSHDFGETYLSYVQTGIYEQFVQYQRQGLQLPIFVPMVESEEKKNG